MEHIYPAVFHHNKDDGSYTITFPDLQGCISEGRGLGNALCMAQDALRQWIEYHIDEKLEFAPPSRIGDVKCGKNEFASLVRAEIRDLKAVKRTVSLPKWMDKEARKAKLSLSRVLQDALEAELA